MISRLAIAWQLRRWQKAGAVETLRRYRRLRRVQSPAEAVVKAALKSKAIHRESRHKSCERTGCGGCRGCSHR